MPNAALFISVFQAVTILGSALTVLKLFTSGLYRRYRFFFGYFIFRIPVMAGGLILRNMTGLRGGDGDRSAEPVKTVWICAAGQPGEAALTRNA